jgi:membrane-bound lytic murein transglycosylase D
MRRMNPRPLASVALTFCFISAGLLGCAAPSLRQVDSKTAPAASPSPTAASSPASRAFSPEMADSTRLETKPEDTSPPWDASKQALLAAEPDEVLPFDPLETGSVIDPKASEAQQDLWQRIRLGFSMPDLDGDLVQDREKFYATRAAYMQRMVARGSRYLFHVVEEIQKRHMPTELALLPFVESAFNPEAMSTAKASGMWQFVPATGRDYALKQNIFRDDRRDVLASTRAALDHLNRLYGLFGDWHLVLAAYNCGEGNVQRAIAKNKAAGKPTDYANLPLPAETRLYVPKLQAVKNIVSRPDQFAIELLPLKNHPYFLSVPITRDVDVDLAARFAGVSVEEFRQLNPQMNKPVILAAGTEQILLPYDNANAFAERWHDHRGPYARWTAWVSPRTLRAAEAAKLVGMPEAQLREVNRIPPRMLVKAGSTLLVPRTSARAADVPEALAENASMSLAPDVPPLRQVTLKAGRKGDSVAAVAKRYRVSPAQVAQWNKVAPAARFKPGASIVVWVQPSTPRVNGNKNKPGERAVKPAKPVRVALQ